MKARLIRWLTWVAGLFGFLLVICIFSLFIGATKIPINNLISLILTGRGTTEYSIIFDIRAPRIILGCAVGGALSVAGLILQGLFRNPLVEPYTLGIAGGAALGVSLNIVLRIYQILGIFTLPIFGFLGAILVVIFVYSLSIKSGILKIHSLLLTGVMISFISSSLILLIMAVSRTEDLHGIIFWIMGSLEEPSWVLIKLTVGVAILGLVISYFFWFALNAFSLGEEEALRLGINTERTKRVLFILTSFLTGVSISVAGIIGFVGLVVPHFVRMFVGYDHRISLICSFLAGGAFLILCDTLARTIISPLELPVGVITGILGGSLFIYALSKRQVVL